MDRRAFCRFMGVCGIAACAGGLAGCARALEWSEAQHARTVTRTFGRSSGAATATAGSAPGTATAGSAAASQAPAGAAYPDLAV